MTNERKLLFGGIEGGTMRLSAAGVIIQSVWENLPTHYPNIETDEFIVMPNHVNGIIVIHANVAVRDVAAIH